MIKAVIFDMYETLITLWYANPYMGHEMSAEAGIPEPVFREIWDPSEADRALGRRKFEDVVEEILRVNGKYDKDLLNRLVSKRKASKAESFDHIHDDVVPLLEALKERGIKIGLITNCFMEEMDVIKESVLYPFFDAVCMSCEVGMKKPDTKIFDLCLDKLMLNAEECLYCGDGGSHELEVARKLGMKPVQALWYLKDGSGQPVGRMPEYVGANNPMDILQFLDKE